MKTTFKSFLISIALFIWLFVAGCNLPASELDSNDPSLIGKTPHPICRQYSNNCSVMPDYETCSLCDCNWDSGFCYGSQAPIYWSAGPEYASYVYPTQFCPDVLTPEITFVARFAGAVGEINIYFEITWGTSGIITESQINTTESMVTWTANPPDAYTEGNLEWHVRLNPINEHQWGIVMMNSCTPLSDSIPEILTPPITPAVAPSSARDCPVGTCFAEVTHRCIAIDFNNLNNGGNGNGGGNSGGGQSCSSYGDYPSCVSGGCTWDGGYCQ